MALNETTMATAISDAMTSFLGPPATTEMGDQRRHLAIAIAHGVCTHIKAHADVRIAAGTVLQRVPNPVTALDPTLGPAADVVLVGAVE